MCRSTPCSPQLCAVNQQWDSNQQYEHHGHTHCSANDTLPAADAGGRQREEILLAFRGHRAGQNELWENERTRVRERGIFRECKSEEHVKWWEETSEQSKFS